MTPDQSVTASRHAHAPAYPLAGVKILDLTTFLSGPFATQILADLGADVIKVESPGGDSSRHIPPHFIDADSAYFLSTNRNKRSMVLDLKKPEDLSVLLSLIQSVDAVVENFRPGVAARLGLDAQALLDEHPRLVWTSISGFGQTGEFRERPAYDMIVQALSGVMSLTGETDRPAVRLGIPAGDLIAGMYGVIGLLAALSDVRRGPGGQGRWVDISMLDSQLSMLSYQAAYALISGETPGPQGAAHDSIPTYRSFRGSDDREFVVTANTEGMWRALCSTMGLEHLTSHPRFENAALRLDNRQHLWAHLEARFAEHSSTYWVDALVRAQVPCALIKNVTEALQDARTSERGMIREVSGARGRFEAVASPIFFVGESPPPDRFPPRLGEHTREVLREFHVGRNETSS